MDQDNHEHSGPTEDALQGFIAGDRHHRKAVQKWVARIVGRHCKANRIVNRPARQEATENVLDELLAHLFDNLEWSVPEIQQFVERSAAKHAKRLQRHTKRMVSAKNTEDGEFDPLDLLHHSGPSPDDQIQYHNLFLLLYVFVDESICAIGPPYDKICREILSAEENRVHPRRTRALSRLRESMLDCCKKRSSEGPNRRLYTSLAIWIETSRRRGSTQFFDVLRGVIQGAIELRLDSLSQPPSPPNRSSSES